MKRIQSAAGGTFCILILTLASLAVAGSLTPPGAPAPSMKTLDQVEPRAPIKQSDLPLTISQPGSYYFSQNLTFTTADANAITISADNVSIDLSGFTLTGPGSTTGSTGSGLFASTGFGSGCVVKNGAVKGFRSAGISLFDNCAVTGVVAESNGGFGIAVIHSCALTNNRSNQNGLGGISAGTRCIISGNHCCQNASAGGTIDVAGIECGSNCTVTDNTCVENAATGFAYGILADDACVITGNTCSGNTSTGGSVFGVAGEDRCTIRGNVCAGNAATAYGRSGTGIYCERYCFVAGNTCSDNQGSGNGFGEGILVYDSFCRIEGNNCSNSGGSNGNNYGIVVFGHPQNVVISNTFANNPNGDVYFYTGTHGNSASGNNTPKGIVDNGANSLDVVIGELPFAIADPGIYRLEGSLSLSAQDTNGIQISADNVVLDLGGGALVGPGKAAGASGDAIVCNAGLKNLKIRNGSIQNWRGNGITASGALTSCRFEGLQITDCGGYGLSAGDQATVSGVTATSNDGAGIVTGAASLIQNNVAAYNGGNGITAGGRCAVSTNNCRANTGNGIQVPGDCFIRENLCSEHSAQAGIHLTGAANVVERNVVTGNVVGIRATSSISYYASNRAAANTTAYGIAAPNIQGAGDLANLILF